MGGIGIKADRVHLPQGDFSLLVLTLALAGAGLAALLSATSGYSLRLGRDPAHFFVRQLWYGIPAAFAWIALSRCSLETVKRSVKWLVLFSLVGLVLPFVPWIGLTLNGASRWIHVGPASFQPSELFKYALVVYLAYILSKKADRIGDVVNAGIPPLVVTAIGCAIIYAQNDFSTAAVVAIAALVMLWIGSLPVAFFAALATVVVPLAALSVLTSDFRLLRVLAFLVPGYEPWTQGYQVAASQRAIASGGLIGRGFGLGTLKNGAIPEVQSDFVFAAWAEELGFAGVFLFFVLWALFAWRGFRVAVRSSDRFASYLAFGLTFVLAFQALVNVAVVVGAVPATGVALPFFSAGGSSLLSSAAACGLLYNLSREIGPGADRIPVEATRDA